MPYWAGPTKTVSVAPSRGGDDIKRVFTPEEWRSYFGRQEPFLSYMERNPKEQYTQEDVTAVYREIHGQPPCPVDHMHGKRQYGYGYKTKNYFTDW